MVELVYDRAADLLFGVVVAVEWWRVAGEVVALIGS